MSLIVILIAYFFDYKSNKTAFLKDLFSGVILCLGFLLSAIGFAAIFGLNIVYAIFYLAIEIILVFALKAFIQTKK
ncbi:hypothetical protein [Winogradskyella forsetii]|uniref:hypothetical protein n=1 Tax=Winogradskyella forsetii TaxID=2686077 RepID=UPI0015C06640|nr:hypothetical protein [Winogradskyella forsetii]